MTIERTKDQLVQLLADVDNKVLALSGRWGTGKTHLLRDVQKASADPVVKNALNASLFGLNDMNQVKLKLVQSALPGANKNAASWRSAAEAIKAAGKVLKGINAGFSALDELALLAVPAILKGKLILLDDIERKHKDLSIDQVLGFIDEFTQEHEARFVLILNSDQLTDKEAWDTLREKVIDQEIWLDTSSAEAFDIAVGLTPSPFQDAIRTAVQACDLTNIRVIRKVIKAVNRIIGERHDLPAAVLSRTIPSTVLLAAINYRGIHDGPSFDYVLRVGGPRDFDEALELADNAQKKEIESRHSDWDAMLAELGIKSCDEYELLVVEFLKSGLFDPTSVSQIIDRYVMEHETIEARNAVHAFLDRLVWDHHLSNADLLVQARELAPRMRFLDPYLASALASNVADLPGGGPVAGALLDGWLQDVQPDLQLDPDDEMFGRPPLHPRIQEFLDTNAADTQARTTVLDAAMSIFARNGWGTRETLAMKSASPEDFEAAIRAADLPTLKRFMRKMIDMCGRRETYVPHFGSAMDHFAEACRRIIADPQSSRLAGLIRLLFAGAKLEGLLVAPVTPS